MLAVVALAAAHSAIADASERDALAVVLADFTARTDLLSMHNDGVTLVRPAVRAWPLEALRTWSLLNRAGTCGITRPMYDALASASAAPPDIVRSLPASNRWRTLDASDLPERSIVLDKTLAGDKIKTIAQLSNAGIDADGSRALLLVNFKWSMHDGIAQYVLARERGAWSVKCSDLVFYP